jgi:hypothetical protein
MDVGSDVVHPCLPLPTSSNQLNIIPTNLLTSENLLSRIFQNQILRLPAELRNKIYEYVIGNKSICLESTYRNEPRGRVHPCETPPARQPYSPDDKEHGAFNILAACRQTYAEARYLPFSLNVFRFERYDCLNGFRDNKFHQLSIISAVRLYALEDHPFVSWDWLDGLLYLRGLKRIEICDRRKYSSWSSANASEAIARLKQDVRGLVERYSPKGVEVIFYHVPY